MEKTQAEIPDELSRQDLSRYVLDMFHRIMVHHTLWFREVEHQIGFEKALEVMEEAYDRSLSIQTERLAQEFGFEMENGVPKPLLDLPKEKLLSLMQTMAKNWLANDGVWFLSMENRHGMNDAKRCNDSCWARYSPFEAWSIKKFLGLPEQAGIQGLKQALRYRMYAQLNTQTIIDEGVDCIQYQMNVCRVQATRKRKNLDDYPCKSAGLVEYTYFARGIDERIQTECIGCPPDCHPEDWFCAWRFRIAGD
ncbi:MAG: DUF6125 family protein [Desulfohalobiaceae bacterium]|nr:DUF6125 family protein [Desulfohalobiaceae bacterium]